MAQTFASLPYSAVTKQIRQSGDLLRLPYQATASALVFLHRFMQQNSGPYTETASVRTNDLLNAVHMVAASPTATNAAGEPARDASAPEFTALVGQSYYSHKQTLILDEQYLLRTIDFGIVVEHPHKYLLNFAKAIGAKHSLVQTSVSILNDSIVYSNLCLSYPPADLAAACLQLGVAILESDVSVQSCGNTSGWTALGVDIERLEVLAGTAAGVIVVQDIRYAGCSRYAYRELLDQAHKLGGSSCVLCQGPGCAPPHNTAILMEAHSVAVGAPALSMKFSPCYMYIS